MKIGAANCDERGGAQRPINRGYEPKKGVRSAAKAHNLFIKE